MPELRYIIGQAIAFTLFAIGLAYFSNSPSYTYLDPGKALIMISFSHAGDRKEDCRHFTSEEIAALAPNMRRPMDCPRERVPLYVEVLMDGKKLSNKSYNPTGLANDGSASVYERIPVNPGKHQIVAKLRDSKRQEGFDYENEISVDLKPKELFIIDFQKKLNGFYFQ